MVYGIAPEIDMTSFDKYCCTYSQMFVLGHYHDIISV